MIAPKPFISILTAVLTVGVGVSDASAKRPSIKLRALDSVTTEPIGETASEIVAHDPSSQRIFVVNALAARIDVISIRNPVNLEKVGEIDVTRYGAVANSVSVHDGLIAVAVEDAVKQNPGKVVFFDQRLRFLSAVTVGALPDMLTFTPDGRHVLVANEGEPNADYTVDPQGTVSIIDVSGDLRKLTQSKVRTVTFTKYNGAVLDPSIRIFGPNATVAQDLEPEYIAVSANSRTAWVTCQENNAIAIIDIRRGIVTDLVGLGFKDHSALAAQSSSYSFDPATMPSIGTTLGGQAIPLGGFSGLHFEGINPVTGRYKFVANTDRGPNAEPTGINRPFLLPNFAPEIVRFELDRESGTLEVTERLSLSKAPGVPLTGISNTAIGASGNTPYNDEVPVDLLGNVLTLDPLGADLEGIAVAPDGSFWMCDEYRPAIYHFDVNGVLIERFVPAGTAAAAGQPAGTFGTEALPAVLAQRRQNRGFEAIAYDDGKLYAFVQSPVRNPVSLSNGALNEMRNIRVVEFDPETQATRQFMYVMDNANLGAGTNSRADKIGDAVALGGGEFLVIERDDDKIQSDEANLIEKKIYRINIADATDVSEHEGLIGSTGKTVDQLTIAEMEDNDINPITKVLHVDLNVVGYNQVEKIEGLALVDASTIAVINDNDFGVASITVNPDGTFIRNYTPEPSQLGLIAFPANGIDASDRDGKINITQWPVKGVDMPDAIAAFKVRGRQYLLTANEGDAREYVGFVEGLRVGSSSIELDPVKFPDAAGLKKNFNLGRLNITSTLGKNPETGLYEELYAFGSRSFSIRDDKGRLVYDSGDDLERITAEAFPENFNASNSSNDFYNRSDDKGPESEGIAVGKVYGQTYAFIALERIGGLMVYDVSKPTAPEFVQYINHRDFSAEPGTPEAGDLGPEGIIFISAADSPTRKPLIITANEISGTTTVFEIERN